MINWSLFNIIFFIFHSLVHLLTRSHIPPRIRQRSVIEFLTEEGEMPIRIHERLKICMGMQQWMSALLDDGFVAVKKLKNKNVKTSLRQWLRRQDLAFYRAGIHALVKRWTKTVEMDGDYIEK